MHLVNTYLAAYQSFSKYVIYVTYMYTMATPPLKLFTAGYMHSGLFGLFLCCSVRAQFVPMQEYVVKVLVKECSGIYSMKIHNRQLQFKNAYFLEYITLSSFTDIKHCIVC